MITIRVMDHPGEDCEIYTTQEVSADIFLFFRTMKVGDKIALDTKKYGLVYPTIHDMVNRLDVPGLDLIVIVTEKLYDPTL